MTSATYDLDNQQREACAISVMRTMLEDYSMENNISFKDAFYQFAASPVYKTLFDFSTGLWREGPDYLREIFEENINNKS